MLKRLFACIFPLILFAEEPIRLTAEAEPLVSIAGCVNVLSGDFFYRNLDLSVEGPTPLNLIRFYDSNHLGASEFGVGMYSQFPHILTMNTSETFETNLKIEERGGMFLPANWKKEGNEHTGEIDKEKLLKSGITNTGSLEVNGSLNGRKIHYLDWRKDKAGYTGGKWKIALPDGSKRVYDYWGRENGWGQFCLKEERLPNGHYLLYEYEKRKKTVGRLHFLPKKVSLMNPDKTLTFSSIDYTYKPYSTKAMASNGQAFEMQLKEKKVNIDRVYFYRAIVPDKTISNWRGDEAFDIGKYVQPSEYYKIREFKFSDGRVVKIDYDSQGKVKKISLPTGSKGSFKTAYEITYKKEESISQEIGGAKSLFEFTEEGRLKKKGIYNQNDLYREEMFIWNEGERRDQLNAVALFNEKGEAHFLKSLQYDSEGAVVKEIYYGNLTGTKEDGFIYDSAFPNSQKVDSYTIERSFSEDAFHNLIWETGPNDTRTCFTYLPKTHLPLSKIIEQSGQIKERVFYEYDSNHLLIQEITDDGSSNEKNNLEGCTYRKFKKSSYYLQEGPFCGRVESETEGYYDLETGLERVLKRVECFYDERGLKTQERLLNANLEPYATREFQYNDQRLCISFTDEIGRVFITEYDTFGRKIYEELQGNGYLRLFSYDAMGNLISETDISPEGEERKTVYEYDTRGNLILKCDPFGRETHFEYDFLNRFISETNACGFKRKVAYDISDNIIFEEDEEGFSKQARFTPYQKPFEKQYSDGSLEIFHYDPSGQLLKQVERDGKSTLFTYDYRGRVVSEEKYDEIGHFLFSSQKKYKGEFLIWEKNALGHKKRYFYDGAGRKIREEFEGRIQEFSYDSLGNLSETHYFDKGEKIYSEIKIFDAASRVIEEYILHSNGKKTEHMKLTYDELDKPLTLSKEIERGFWICETKNYDWLGRLVYEEDGAGNVTRYHFEEGFESIHETVSSKGVITRQYLDPLGNLWKEEVVNPYGGIEASSIHIYDKCNREVISRSSILFKGENQGFFEVQKEYDGEGRLVSRTEQPLHNQARRQIYSYDACGRLIEEITKKGDVLTRTYSSLGELDKLISNDGTLHFSYIRDVFGNPLQVENHISGAISFFQYNVFGEVEKEVQESGLELKINYNDLGKIEKITLPDESNIAYQYEGKYLKSVLRKGLEHIYSERDSFGRPLKIEGASGAIPLEFSWDFLGRIEKIVSPSSLENVLKRDSEGNLLRKSLDIEGDKTEQEYVYNHLNQLIEENGNYNHKYQWDSLYNQREKDSFEEIYSEFNELESFGEVAFKSDSGGNCIQEGEKSYSYDALGQLIKIELPEKIICYSYDHQGRRFREIHKDLSGDTLKEVSYFYLGIWELGRWQDNQIDQLKILGSGIHSMEGSPVVLELNGENYFPVPNLRGDLSLLLDDHGKIIEKIIYSGFAEEQNSERLSPWRFSGKRTCEETGLVFFPKRVYDPFSSRWLTPDPAGDIDGPNLYAYVHANPIGFLDPTGLFIFDLFKKCTLARDGSILYLDREREKRINTFRNQENNCSHIVDLAGKRRVEGIAVTFINGICTTEEEFMNHMEFISKIGNNIEVSGVYNKTYGMFLDMRECFNGLFLNHVTDPAFELIKLWTKKGEEVGENGIIFHHCFSQGAIHTRLALSCIPRDLADKIHVRAYAPAMIISRRLAASVKNYVSVYDVVPKCDFWGTFRNFSDIEFYFGDGPIADHSFQSAYHERFLRNEFNIFLGGDEV